MRRLWMLFVSVAAVITAQQFDTHRSEAGEVIYYAPPVRYVQSPLWYYPEPMVIAPGPILTYEYPPPVVYVPPPTVVYEPVYAVPVVRPRTVYVRRPRYYYSYGYYGW